MQKVDLVIAGVGAFALVATVLGIVFYEEAVGEQTFEFREVTREGAFDSKTGTGASPSFEWDVPDNTTGADFEVEVTATGTSLVGGSVSISVILTAPDGSTEQESGSITVPQGSATSGTWRTTVQIALDWFEIPDPVTTDDPDSINATTVWTDPIKIEVTITGPGNAGGDSLTYATAATGDATAYERAPPQIPDPTGAQ